MFIQAFQMISKSKLKEQIEGMPDQFTLDELVERLVFMNKVENGLSDSKNEKTISEAQLDKEMKKWFK